MKYGTGVKANPNILSTNLECFYHQYGKIVQATFAISIGSSNISNSGIAIISGLPAATIGSQYFGVLHSANINYPPVTICIGDDGKLYTWYCGDLIANAGYRGFIVYMCK